MTPRGAYYNEPDLYAAEWLRALIVFGMIAPGDVDTRRIEDVAPDDLRGYTQCHFFAGIGVWSRALRRAGWPDDRRIWTGSCPCQPFSAAGRGDGFADERHLWPYWHWLIEQCRPANVLGEQVAGKDAEPWLDLVQADLEGLDYAFGCVPFPAASVGAPHIRDRLYWVAHSSSARLEGGDTRTVGYELAALERGSAPHGVGHTNGVRSGGHAGASYRAQGGPWGHRQDSDSAIASGFVRGLADRTGSGFDGRRLQQPSEQHRPEQPSGSGVAYWLGDSDDRGFTPGRTAPEAVGYGRASDADGGPDGLPDIDDNADGLLRPGPTNGFWRDADWLGCTDGKWRPVEPGTQPLAHGATARVGRLRAYGNAINAEQAAAFIEAIDGVLFG